jgi:hypothetical protein
MREIIIIRKKSFNASLMSPLIVVDGEAMAKVKNGETAKIAVDENEHEIYTYTTQGKGNVLNIGPGEKNIVLNLKYAYPKFILTPETTDLHSSVLETQSSVQEVVPEPVPPKSQVGSYICGIILSLFLLWLSFYLYSGQETSMIGLISGIMFSIASGVVFIMGGFWFIVIPLPFVYIWKAGCNKPNQSSKRKIILGILSFLFPVMAIMMLLLLRNINIL